MSTLSPIGQDKCIISAPSPYDKFGYAYLFVGEARLPVAVVIYYVTSETRSLARPAKLTVYIKIHYILLNIYIHPHDDIVFY